VNFSELTGRLLLATPSMHDPNFSDGVVLLCHHDEHGSMGLLVNRPQDITVGSVLEDMQLTEKHDSEQVVFEGGPVEPFRGFVLHDGWQVYDSTLVVTPELHLTTSKDILEEIAYDAGPEHFMLILGYAGWDAGQLEEEIQRNDWLVAPASHDLLFHVPAESRWMLGAQSMGVDRAQLSSQVGHA